MKKLVPAMRSSSNRIPPPRRTGNDNNASTAVVNHAQQVSGMRISDMPFVRMFKRVVMKFNAPSSEPTQKIAMLITQRFMPAPWPGPAILPSALKWSVAGPTSNWSNRAAAAGERWSKTRKPFTNTLIAFNENRQQDDDEADERHPERQHVQDGNAMSSAPIWIGRK